MSFCYHSITSFFFIADFSQKGVGSIKFHQLIICYFTSINRNRENSPYQFLIFGKKSSYLDNLKSHIIHSFLSLGTISKRESQVPKFLSPQTTNLLNGTKIGEVIFPTIFLKPFIIAILDLHLYKSYLFPPK